MLLFAVLPLAAEKSPNGFEYTRAIDGVYYLYKTSYSQQYYIVVDADYTENLVILDDIDGLPVTYVSNMSDRTDLESVSLGANVGGGDFLYCRYITEVDFSRVKVVNKCRFWECDVRELTIPAGVQADFRWCKNLEKVTFTGDAGGGSYDDCPKLHTVVTHPDMTVMPSFKNCTALTSIDIPADIHILDGFNGCNALETVNLAANPSLYIIRANAFRATAISEFKCPESLRTIEAGAFAGTKIAEFKFPSNFVVKINEKIDGVYCNSTSANAASIFDGCNLLAKIEYPSVKTLLEISPGFDFGRYLSGTQKPDRAVELWVDGAVLEEIDIPATANGFGLSYTSGLKTMRVANVTSRLTGSAEAIPTLERVEIGAGEVLISFAACRGLKDVSVSEKNRTTYLASSFSGCTSLESIYFPNVSELRGDVFEGCSSLKVVGLPKLTELNGGCDFKDCVSLVSVDFPNLEGTMGSGSFYGCTALERVNIPKVTELKESSWYGVFENCSALKTIECESLKIIGQNAFKNCTSLEAFDFSTRERVGADAFRNTALVDVEIPVTCEVGGGAFSDLPKLRTLTAPVYGRFKISGLPVVEQLTFTPVTDHAPELECWDCFTESTGSITVNGALSALSLGNLPNFKRLTLRGPVTNDFYMRINTVPDEFDVSSLSDYISCRFRNNAFTPGYFADVHKPIDFYIMGRLTKNLLIPHATSLPDYCFNMFNIESVTFLGFKSDEPTSVNKAVFKNCTNLRELKFQGNVDHIGDEAFMNTGLEVVELPSTVKSIGVQSFSSNKKLTHITFSPAITHFADGAVINCPLLERVILPEGARTCGYQIVTGTNNKGLRTISLPATLETLSKGFRPSFENITTDVEFISWAPVGPGGNMDNFTGHTVHVPVGYGDSYRNKAIWNGAVIVEDLLVGQNAEVVGTDVTITVPVQTAISDDARVAKYVVDCYDADDETASEPLASFVFDGNGMPQKAAVAPMAEDSQWQELKLTGLEPQRNYRLDITGFTPTGDLVYKHSSAVATGDETTGTMDAEETGHITLRGDVVTLPSCYGGEILRIYTIAGREVFAKPVNIGGDVIKLNLDCGFYILDCGTTNMKMKI